MTIPLPRCFVLLALVASTHIAQAETVSQITNPRRANGTWVSDMARVLDGATERRLNARLDWLERKTTAEMAVVTIRRTNGQSPKQFAMKLFNTWGIGKRGKNNGVLMLLVMDARRIEVETGNGMSRVLPDERVQDVLNTSVVPRFRDDDYAGGVLEAVRILTDDIANRRASSSKPQAAIAHRAIPSHTRQSSTRIVSPPPSPPSFGSTSSAPSYVPSYAVNQPTSSGNSTSWIPLLLGFLGLPVLGLALWKGSQRHCPECNALMRKLDEYEDDASLAGDQQFEERLGGVDYRVWRCDACNYQTTERAKRWFSGYEDCPHCGRCTVNTERRVIQTATYDNSGLEESIRTCQFPHCNFHDVQTVTLPQLTRPSTTHNHSSTRSSHSSTQNSSSRSSNRDFGGGSSSGGGAGASW
jgi:uncharacterized protein